jgi:hypothetical protein
MFIISFIVNIIIYGILPITIFILLLKYFCSFSPKYNSYTIENIINDKGKNTLQSNEIEVKEIKRIQDVITCLIKKFEISRIGQLEGFCFDFDSYYALPRLSFYYSNDNVGGYFKTSIEIEGKTQIEFNKKYISKNGIVDSDTIIHETAHFIDYNIRGFTIHDKTWQKIYEAIGGKDKYSWE